MNGGRDSIPAWDRDGLLPANDLDNPTSKIRSPYTVSLFDLAERFGNTEPRRRLLRGLLDFRAELHEAGLTQGFQWINGSFLEDVESRNARPPNDIDLVTFFYIPDGYTGQRLLEDFPSLSDRAALKNRYAVDSYYAQLNQVTSEEIIDSAKYWYSLWSHTRDGNWKGYLQIDLADADDKQARLQLDQRNGDGGGQT